ILAHPDLAAALNADPALLDELRRTLQQAGGEAGLTFSGPVAMRATAEPRLAPGEMHVLAGDSLEGVAETSDVIVSPAERQPAIPQGAFLIVDGVRIFPLEQPVVNIGRRPDNHLAVDDRRVSRLHAQLRAVGGCYVIFDLDSAGGTWVNGQRIRQQALAPGDVISLGGAPLVYGQDEADTAQTQELAPPG
ncbi:MAG: FHA domain-containing protein, partial [Anaerolineales bacterium]|nr:FHA domain-containing protein [Anaerolineales bacterium]